MMPLPEQFSTVPGQAPEQAPSTVEQVPAGPEQTSSAAQAVPQVPVSIPLPIPPTLQQTDVTTTTNIVTPAIADDADLIEKEWVDKAKKLVEDNRDNPYKQSEDLTVVKADYMQKRYNKTVKLTK